LKRTKNNAEIINSDKGSVVFLISKARGNPFLGTLKVELQFPYLLS